jgi:hypothetical protein
VLQSIIRKDVSKGGEANIPAASKKSYPLKLAFFFVYEKKAYSVHVHADVFVAITFRSQLCLGIIEMHAA